MATGTANCLPPPPLPRRCSGAKRAVTPAETHLVPLMLPAGAGMGAAEPLEWHFSQVFGERAPGEEVQEGERPRVGRLASAKGRLLGQHYRNITDVANICQPDLQLFSAHVLARCRLSCRCLARCLLSNACAYLASWLAVANSPLGVRSCSRHNLCCGV